jgi:hypothetical protein
MKATVLKVMICNGETLKQGDIVDVSSWKHVKNLVGNRYIKLIEEAVEKPTAKKAVASK